MYNLFDFSLMYRFLLSLFFIPCFAFTQIPDSLTSQLDPSAKDTVYARGLIRICAWARQNDTRVLDSIAKELSQFSQKIDYGFGVAAADEELAIASYFANQIARADSLFLSAYDKFSAMGKRERAIANQTKSGIMKMSQGQYDLALNIYNRSIGESKKYKLWNAYTHALNEKATIYHYKAQYDSAREQYEFAIEQSKRYEQIRNYERALFNLAVM